ncbi:MAG: tetratricopeptide repeat protein [Bacteriovoracia bacterium]
MLTEIKNLSKKTKMLLGIVFVASTVAIVVLARETIDGNRYLYSEGIVAMNQKQYDKAALIFAKALKRNPSDCGSRFGLAWAYQMKGQLPQSTPQYREMISNCESLLVFAYANFGLILQASSNDREAKAFYTKALTLDPSNKLIHERLSAFTPKKK